jgi:hypothetical protein
MTKNLNEYTLEEFREMELFGEDCLFNNVVIVPMNELHDYSGYRCMKFILCHKGVIVGAVGGWCDVVHPNGIGNHGLSGDWSVTPNIGLHIDCLKGSGCVRLMMNGLYECDDFICSDFIFYKTGETE